MKYIKDHPKASKLWYLFIKKDEQGNISEVDLHQENYIFERYETGKMIPEIHYNFDWERDITIRIETGKMIPEVKRGNVLKTDRGWERINNFIFELDVEFPTEIDHAPSTDWVVFEDGNIKLKISTRNFLPLILTDYFNPETKRISGLFTFYAQGYTIGIKPYKD